MLMLLMLLRCDTQKLLLHMRDGHHLGQGEVSAIASATATASSVALDNDRLLPVERRGVHSVSATTATATAIHIGIGCGGRLVPSVAAGCRVFRLL